MNNLAVLLEKVAGYMSKARFTHTIGVIELAEELSAYFDEINIDQLKYAAALHDIAKEIPYDEQLALIDSYGISLTDEDINTPQALHSFAGPALIKRDFPEYAEPSVLSSVMNHTLGAVGMSTFDKLIFISDYAERGRNNAASAEIRSYLEANLNKEDRRKNLEVLDRAVVMAIDYTESYLRSKGKSINSRSKELKKSLLP